MYYINHEQIAVRLQVVPDLTKALTELTANWSGALLQSLALERVLHLGIEIVTDVGSYLIDGFIMRDASSYEDIVDVLGDEKVINPSLHEGLVRLVRLRKAIAQDYFSWDRTALHPIVHELSEQLRLFKSEVERYLLEES